MKTIAICILIALAALAGCAVYFASSRPTAIVGFRTAVVRRGELSVTVSATGTLEPEDLVDVGAQVVGRVKELGTDARGEVGEGTFINMIDYGSSVRENQVLAVIDDSVYRAQWNQAKATLQRSEADMLQLQAKLIQADAEWTRAKKLRTYKSGSGSPQSSGGVITESDFVTAQCNYEVAKANIEVGKATIAQNAASLEQAETNLAYTVIRSPVSGTIIDRRVNVGQTVVSNLSAPSLFLIAKDLKRMQVWASVNEADIGLIQVGMPVEFTVDAFPDAVFAGSVVQIRLNATMTQNVVTYTVVIANDNSDLKLLPYLTADVKFLVRRKPDVVLVPSAALRYRPSPELILPQPANPISSADQSLASTSGTAKPGTVWVRRGHFVSRVIVDIGETNDSLTEVQGDLLAVGDEVVLGESQTSVAQEVTNPFAPPKIPKQTSTNPTEKPRHE